MVVAATINLFGVVQPETTTKEKRYQVFEAIVNTNETIPLEIGTLTDVAVFRVSTGLEVTATIATTIVTVTEAALVNVKVVGLAFGAV